MFVNLQKLGNEYKNIKQLRIPLGTIRAIITKFQKIGTVKIPGTYQHTILHLPHTVRRTVREATKNPKITVSEFHSLLSSLKKYIIYHFYNNSLEELKPFLRKPN